MHLVLFLPNPGYIQYIFYLLYPGYIHFLFAVSWIHTVSVYCIVDIYSFCLLYPGYIHFLFTVSWIHTFSVYCILDIYIFCLLYPGFEFEPKMELKKLYIYITRNKVHMFIVLYIVRFPPERNWVFGTNSNFIIPLSLIPDVIDFQYF